MHGTELNDLSENYKKELVTLSNAISFLRHSIETQPLDEQVDAVFVEAQARGIAISPDQALGIAESHKRSFVTISTTILNSIIIRQVAIVEKYLVELAFKVYEGLTESRENYYHPTFKINNNHEKFSDCEDAVKSLEANLNIKLTVTVGWKIFKHIRSDIRNKLAHGDVTFKLKVPIADEINKKFSKDLVVRCKAFDNHIKIGKKDAGHNTKAPQAVANDACAKPLPFCVPSYRLSSKSSDYGYPVPNDSSPDSDKDMYLYEVSSNFESFQELNNIFIKEIEDINIKVNNAFAGVFDKLLPTEKVKIVNKNNAETQVMLIPEILGKSDPAYLLYDGKVFEVKKGPPIESGSQITAEQWLTSHVDISQPAKKWGFDYEFFLMMSDGKIVPLEFDNE